MLKTYSMLSLAVVGSAPPSLSPVQHKLHQVSRGHSQLVDWDPWTLL